MVTYESQKRHLTRLKNALVPNAPRTAADILSLFCKEEILERFGKMYAGTVIEPNYKFTIFRSKFAIETMNKSTDRIFFVDGTFRVVPDGEYVQLLIVHWGFQNMVRNENIL